MSLVPLAASDDERGTELRPDQKLRLREQLTGRWQAEVTRITELSLRRHDRHGVPAHGEARDLDERTLVAELSGARLTLMEIETALGRLDAGTYGTCHACGSGVPFGRLLAMPQGLYCEPCDRAAG